MGRKAELPGEPNRPVDDLMGQLSGARHQFFLAGGSADKVCAIPRRRKIRVAERIPESQTQDIHPIDAEKKIAVGLTTRNHDARCLRVLLRSKPAERARQNYRTRAEVRNTGGFLRKELHLRLRLLESGFLRWCPVSSFSGHVQRFSSRAFRDTDRSKAPLVGPASGQLADASGKARELAQGHEDAERGKTRSQKSPLSTGLRQRCVR
jgi:hypothetical protein